MIIPCDNNVPVCGYIAGKKDTPKTYPNLCYFKYITGLAAHEKGKAAGTSKEVFQRSTWTRGACK